MRITKAKKQTKCESPTLGIYRWAAEYWMDEAQLARNGLLAVNQRMDVLSAKLAELDLRITKLEQHQ